MSAPVTILLLRVKAWNANIRHIHIIECPEVRNYLQTYQADIVGRGDAGRDLDDHPRILHRAYGHHDAPLHVHRPPQFDNGPCISLSAAGESETNSSSRVGTARRQACGVRRVVGEQNGRGVESGEPDFERSGPDRSIDKERFPAAVHANVGRTRRSQLAGFDLSCYHGPPEPVFFVRPKHFYFLYSL